MKITLLIIGLLGWVASLHAQDPTGVFTTQKEQIKKDVYDEALGTTGLLLTFEYYYKSTSERFSLHYPKVTLYQNGLNVYSEGRTVLPLKANEWTKAQIFIPYRKVNLFQGVQEALTIAVELNDWWTYQTQISYEQPLRYKIDLQVRNGAVKEKLTPYDEGGPMQEWLPDPYFALTTNGGTQPLYTSKVAFNQYQLPTPAVSVYVLEGERLLWSFYDRDGAEDELLGVYDALVNKGTFYEDYYGEMFGAIKNLEFTYARKAQVPQAINIYSDPNYEYQGKKGVALTVKYDLPQAYIGQQAQPVFEFYDKNGIELNIPVVYPLNGAAALDEEMTLKRRGQVQYFVPFYVWKEACQAIEFSFARGEEERIRAARHVLRQPIQFASWVIDADLAVVQGVRYQGANGVELQVRYELTKVYENAPLFVRFYRADGSALPFKVYYIKRKYNTSVINGEHQIDEPKASDRLSYFIPYSVLEEEVVAVRAELVPDVAMTIFEKFTPILTGKGQAKDVNLRLVKAEQRFRSDNYGQVVMLKMDIPDFYRENCQLFLELKEDDRISKKILVDGAALQADDSYTLKNDSGLVYLVVPYRNATPSSVFSIQAHVLNRKTQRVMSDSIYWSWTAPRELFNTEIEVDLVVCKFEKNVLRDTSLRQNFPWQYVILAGNDVLVQEPLSQKFSKNKTQFNRKIRVNREDNLTIKLVNTKTKRNLILWKGDLSKWEQSGFKTTVENKYPVKVVKVIAKVPQNYGENVVPSTTDTSKL